ncbi:hypothetical protein C8Q79DRAFT_1010960 [Trametes meyenii]|nr:hypothetical protein C8Q79DRAFT_1010960 [Trametes meyenii]
MGFASLRALHACIGSAIDDLERIYHDHSQAEPVDFPHLDDPYYAQGTHSAAEKLIQQLHDDPAVSFASQKIVAACGQLDAIVSKPWFGLMKDLQAGQLSQAIRFLEVAHIPEILREAGIEGLHVKDIHRFVVKLRPEHCVLPDPAIFTPERLGHILRLLATSHWVREVAPDVFANNRRSSYIDSGKTLEQLRVEPEKKYFDTNGVAAFVGLVGDDCFKFMAYMTEWFLPDTRAGNLSAWGSKYAPLFESGRVSFRVRDLFSEWVSLASGQTPDVFLLRLILHDWPDDESRRILRRLRSAAGPNTKLVIGDMLLPYTCRSEHAFASEDSPLLPNLGVANIHGYLIDILMLNVFGGAKERNVGEMSELALSAGWMVTDIRRSPGSLWAYTTAVPV